MNIQLYKFRNTLRVFKSVKNNIPISWVEVFIEVALKQGQSVQEIAKSVDKDTACVSQIIESLGAYALIRKSKDAKEWRVRRVHLTQGGKYLAEKLGIEMM